MNKQNIHHLFTLAQIQRSKPPRLGQILVELGYLEPWDLMRVLALRRAHDAKIGEILVNHNIITDEQLLHALRQQYGLDMMDISDATVPPILAGLFAPQDCLRLDFIALSLDKNTVTVALADPSKRAEIHRHIAHLGKRATFVLAQRQAIQDKIAQTYRETLTLRARTICPQEYSCRQILNPTARLAFALALLGIAGVLATAGVFWLTIFSLACALMLLTVALKLLALVGFAISRFKRAPKPRKNARLPRISVLIPLFYEADIAPRLIERMKNLDYPRELLDICLVVEEEDTALQTQLRKTPLPRWMRMIVAPFDTLRTKPRALNYALDFTHGELVGIYDAEDAPHRDQLRKVARHLLAAPPEVACVQAELDYYNTRTNWLSRCFALEYATLFRTVIKGQDALRLPILLGGTSVFFKRDILESVGRWDAHNVTEDADLGVRLYRAGYRCECVDSVTFEEANFRAAPWIKQRSRWLKGFLLTWAVHIRRPFALWRDLGTVGILSMTGSLLGGGLAFMCLPLVMPLGLLYFGWDVPIYRGFPPWLLHGVFFAFFISEAIHIALYWVATRGRAHRHLRWVIPTLWLYWPLGFVASAKAIYEIIRRPTYWAKTEHGVNDARFEARINVLTIND